MQKRITLAAALQTKSQAAKLIFYLVLWYVTAAASSISSKVILENFPYPVTVSAAQQLMAIIGAGSIMRFRAPGMQEMLHVVPVSFAIICSSLSFRISLMYISVALSHTIKTLQPVFALLVSRLLLQEHHTWPIYASLIPVITGVFMTTFADFNGELIGICCAVFSTLSLAVQNVISKKVLETGAVQKDYLFGVAAVYTFILCLIPWVFIEYPILNKAAFTTQTMRLLVFNCLSSFLNQYSSFTVLDMLCSPVSHAVANVMKGAAIILGALLYFGKQLPPTSYVGILLALSGVYCYQIATNGKSPTKYERVPFKLRVGQGAVLPIKISPSADYRLTMAAPTCKLECVSVLQTNAAPNDGLASIHTIQRKRDNFVLIFK